jgi:dihydrolipoamide dehydrogenase
VVRLPANQAEPAQYDIVVIGGGPGGYATALYAGAAGLSVAVVEKDKVGGTCLHRGCVPAKEFLETASVFRGVEGAKEFGVHASQPSVEFSISQDRKNQVVDQLFKGLSGLLRQRKVTIVPGVGRLLPGKTVEVTGADGALSKLAGSNVVLASGSVPRTLPGFEVDGRYVQTSDELLDLRQLPRSAAVIGAGAIGCEFASMLSDLGVRVTLLEALPKILPGCDQDVANVIVRSFTKRRITVRTGVSVTGHEPDGEHTSVIFADGEKLEVETILMSIGRGPLSKGLLAKGTGVEIDERGYVRVDEWMRTGTDGVFAIGDLVATPQLAHVAFAEAILAVKQMLGERAVPVDYGKVPWAIYCHPEVAFVGMTEQAALEAGLEIVTKRDPFGGNSRARILGETDGLVKVICEKGPDGRAGRLVGVHMAGPWVTEQLGQAYLSVNWEATPDEISQFIQPHPTLSETFGETVLALTGRGLHVA